MISRSRRRLRSWMFVYVGLAAAILLAGRPAPMTEQPRVELPDTRLVPVAPLLRHDI